MNLDNIAISFDDVLVDEESITFYGSGSHRGGAVRVEFFEE